MTWPPDIGITPYFADESVAIYHADCRDVLPTLDAGSVDLVLTDPPYGIGKADWDDEFPTWWMEDAALIAKSHLAVMPGTWNLMAMPKAIGSMTYKWTLSAHLTNGMTRGGLGFGNWIPLVIYSRQQTREEVINWCAAFADWCDGEGIERGDLDRAAGTSDMGGWWKSRLPHRCAVPAPHQWAKIKAAFSLPEHFDALVQPSDYEPRGDCKPFVVGLSDKPDHPTPKPLNVVNWFLDSLPGKTVLDPFMGSGTTLRAAKDLGRRAIGIEIEERYCEIAAKRMAQLAMPLEVRA